MRASSSPAGKTVASLSLYGIFSSRPENVVVVAGVTRELRKLDPNCFLFVCLFWFFVLFCFLANVPLANSSQWSPQTPYLRNGEIDSTFLMGISSG